MHFPQAFPLTADGVPAVKWSNPEICRPTEAFGPDGAYGLPTGTRNGFWALDLDKKNGKDGLTSLVAYAADHGGLPDTYTVRTRNGGLHLYFQWDPSHPVGNRVGVLPGVDVRGQGGYVRAGDGYAVLLDVPPAPAPEWLLQFVGKKEDVPTESAIAIGPEHPEWGNRLEMASHFISHEPPCISGKGGQAQLWKMALRLMRTYELPTETAMGLLEGYNATCQPPWTAQELARTLNRAAEEGQGATGTFAASFMNGAAVPVPVEDGPWRQVRDPNHKYEVTMTSVCGGAPVQTSSRSPRELARMFTGAGATAAYWRGVWQYDEFRRRIIAINPPMHLDAETSGLSAMDLSRVQAWADANQAKATDGQIASAIRVAASEARFHPIRDYLNALQKVPLAEADRYFQGIAGRLWGATERDALESAHVRRFAIAAVRRIRAPGTKVDNMLVLAGEQGFRKSTLCAKLFGEYFLDQMPSLEKDKEASIAIEGYWGIEFGELRSFGQASEATKKAFITRTADKYRPVWDKQIQVFPRECVFAATTNDDDFLTDPTGDTRYDILSIDNPIDLDQLDRDEFWACANTLEASGETHFRDRALQARSSAEESAQENAAFHHEHPWTSRVLKFCEALQPSVDGTRYVSAEDVLEKCLVLPVEKQDTKAQNVVKGILRRAYGASQTRRVGQRTQRFYRVK